MSELMGLSHDHNADIENNHREGTQARRSSSSGQIDLNARVASTGTADADLAPFLGITACINKVEPGHTISMRPTIYCAAHIIFFYTSFRALTKGEQDQPSPPQAVLHPSQVKHGAPLDQACIHLNGSW